MSERSVPIPPSALEITDLRRVIESAARDDAVRFDRTRALIELLGLVGVTAAFVAVASATSWRVAIAGGSILLLVGLVVVVAIPLQLAASRARASLDRVACAVDDATSALIRHLASIGYTLPDAVAADWLTSPAPTATVPLVHGSVIAARWWRPAEGDDRVFVEALLRQGDRDAVLPVLPALGGQHS